MRLWTTAIPVKYIRVFSTSMDDFKRLLQYVKPHWLTFLLALVAMVMVAVFETATGALLVPIFDQFIPSTGQRSKTLFDLHSLIPANDWYRAWIIISGLLLASRSVKEFRNTSRRI